MRGWGKRRLALSNEAFLLAHARSTYRASSHAPDCLQLSKDSSGTKLGWGKHGALGAAATLGNQTQVPLLRRLRLDLLQLPP